MQTAQISGLAGEVHQDVEAYQNYGFSSVNHKASDNGNQSEALIENINGTPVCIVADDRRYRPVNQTEGSVMMYTSDQTQRVTLIPGQSVTISTGSLLIALDSGGNVINILGNVVITGDLTISGNVTNAGKDIGKDHAHFSVQPGSGTSGAVV